MTDAPIETFEREPRAGDLLEFYQERVIPTGTWHLELDELLDELGRELADELTKRGFRVGYNAFLSRAESTAFTYTLHVALRVHEVPTVPVEPDGEQRAAVSPTAVFWVVAALVGGGLVGWALDSGARIVEVAPEAVEELSASVQTVAVAAALIALVFLLHKALR